MYDFLEGEVVAHAPARLVVRVGGVGYDLSVPLGSSFPSKEGEATVRVWTHLWVREDAQRLFGFPDRRTREIFRLLLKVRGVGPSMALGVLSGLPAEDLLGAIRDGDSAALCQVKGVGKKTAEQIVLDLRDLAPSLLSQFESAGGGEHGEWIPRPVGRDSMADAIQALTSIGYSEKEARRRVQHAAQKVDPTDIELLVRTAIQK